MQTQKICWECGNETAEYNSQTVFSKYSAVTRIKEVFVCTNCGHKTTQSYAVNAGGQSF